MQRNATDATLLLPHVTILSTEGDHACLMGGQLPLYGKNTRTGADGSGLSSAPDLTLLNSAWRLSSSSERAALDVVDGTGRFDGFGPHYSRRTPGSKTFTGVGREIVLVTKCGRAVWACVYQRTPSARGTGGSRGRTGTADTKSRYLWRNMMFRNLGAGLSSTLIADATEETYRQWRARYGELPPERLRTEIGVRQIRSPNPGYCYQRAGWERGDTRNGKLFFWAPPR
jgi:hypothetical protein